jgi:serine/threonine-protein kinase
MDYSAISGEWVGRSIDGRFPLLKWLGGSGSGGVYLTELGGPGSQRAALKLIPADADEVEARLSGWAAASALSHPHLMRLLHHGRCYCDGVPLLYVVTEYADEILSQILPERALTPAEVEGMLGPILDVLTYLHARGFVHGHLRPANIMVVDDTLKLSADGLRLAGAQPGPLAARGVYDAPECADGTVSTASDLWALGATIVEALTQHPPDLDENGDPVIPETIPPPFAAIARECLRSHPVRRSTVRDVKARLVPAPLVPAPVAAAPVAQASKAASEIGPAAGATSVPVSKAAYPRFPIKPLVALVIFLFLIAAALLLRSHKAQSAADEASPADVSSQDQEAPAPAPKGKQASPAEGGVAKRVMPPVPDFARATIHGKFDTAIRVTVDARGAVSDATIATPGPSKFFANLALDASKRWRFDPPRPEGQPVASVWVIRYEFTQSGAEANAVEVSP